MGISILYRHTCAYSFQNLAQIRKKEIFVPNKKYIGGHRREIINVVDNCIVHMYITAELKTPGFLFSVFSWGGCAKIFFFSLKD